MKRYEFYLIASIAAVMLTSHLLIVTAHASTIRYSWSGQIVAAGSIDPWLVGEQGQDFELDLTVLGSADDLHDINVEFAAFEVLDARLLVDGHELKFTGATTIDFTDEHAELFDLMVFHGNFERFGYTIEIGSATLVPISSFQLSQAISFPPVFSSTTNQVRSTCCGGTYATVVSAGTAVSVIPEPASVFWCLTGLMFIGTLSRRYRWVPSIKIVG